MAIEAQQVVERIEGSLLKTACTGGGRRQLVEAHACFLLLRRHTILPVVEKVRRFPVVD